MPLAGLILNRTHPLLSSLSMERAIDGAEDLERAPANSGDVTAAAVLRIHADRAQTAKREIRLLSRFTGANPHVAVVECRHSRSTSTTSKRCRRSPIRSPARQG